MKVPMFSIRNATQHAYEWTYGHLRAMSDGVDDAILKSVSKDAADALGNALLCDLPKNGVWIVPAEADKT